MASAVLGGKFQALAYLREIQEAAASYIKSRQEALQDPEYRPAQDILASLMNIQHNKGEEKDFGTTEVQVEVYSALFVRLPLLRTSLV
jgi:hypothetical protein